MSLSARIEPIRLPLVSAMPTGHGAIRHRTGLLLGLDDAEHVGWGEASPLPGWSQHALTETELALRAALEEVRTDRDIPAAIAGVHGYPHARAALAGAWADLRARREGLPLAPALSGRWRTDVPVNALFAAPDLAVLEQEAEAAIAAGFTAFKLKVGATAPEADVERIRALRAAGPGVSLRLDANQAWDRPTAIDVLRRVADQDIAWCEEPTALLDDFAPIESSTGVRVAVDESIVTETDLRHALGSGLTVVVVKPQATGGPDRAATTAAVTAEVGGTMVVTSFMDSAVGVAHALHVASAFGSPVAHGLATGGHLAADVGPALAVENGHVRIPASPGIGFEPRLQPR